MHFKEVKHYIPVCYVSAYSSAYIIYIISNALLRKCICEFRYALINALYQLADCQFIRSNQCIKPAKFRFFDKATSQRISLTHPDLN